MTTMLMVTMKPTIEALWQSLRQKGSANAQQRIDSDHPFDIYVDFESPNRPGLIVVCSQRPSKPRLLRAVAMDIGRRADDRWSIQISLEEPNLLPVFAALCKDIIDFTRHGINEIQLAATVFTRIENWRSLLEKDMTAMDNTTLRGLIGEELISSTTPAEALASWVGPLRMPQDFLLASGHRIEVKAVRQNAISVRINGLDQLDPGSDTMELAIVRVENTGSAALNAVTVPILVKRIGERLADDPDALEVFAASLAFAGWHDHPKHHDLVVRIVAIERISVLADFPRLTRAAVPAGVRDADYTITLPGGLSPPVGAE
jgi:hypothetical protein